MCAWCVCVCGCMCVCIRACVQRACMLVCEVIKFIRVLVSGPFPVPVFVTLSTV